MLHAIRQRVTIGQDGVIKIYVPELKAGTVADLIILKAPDLALKKTLAGIIGKGKGCYKTAEEVDAFIKNERISWE